MRINKVDMAGQGSPVTEGIILNINDRILANIEREALFEIIQGMNVTSNLDDLFTLIHLALKKVIFAENCFIALYNPQTSLFEFPFFVDQYDPAPPPQKAERTATDYVFHTGRPALFTKSGFQEMVERGEAEIVGMGSHSWMGAPLRTPTGMIGVLTVQSYDDENAYNERDLEFFASVGSQVALAIERKLSEQALRQAHDELEAKVAERTAELAEAIDILRVEIAERQRTEMAMRATELLFSLAFHACPVPMGIIEFKDNCYQDVNESFLRVSGYTRDEVIGRTAEELKLWAKPSELARFRQQFKEQGSVQELEFSFRIKSGQLRCFMVSAQDFEVGGRRYLFAIANDITDRKQAEEALRDSESRYRLLFENNPHPMWVYDLDTLAFLAVNEMAIRHYGYSRSEFLSLTIKDIRLPEDIPLLLDNIKKTVSSSSDSSGTWRHRKKDGTIIEIEIRSHALNFGGRSSRLVLANDITERNQIEAERLQLHAKIQKSVAEWQLTFDAIESPVLILDGEGRITKLNYAARQLTRGDNVVGRTIESLGATTIWQTATELVGLIRDNRISDTRQAHDEASGRTWDLAASLAGGVEDYDQHIILVIREITKMMELQATLHHSEKMSLLGSLVSGVAHEVRNPLFGISSTLDAFEARFGAAEEYQRYITVLHNEVNRLNDLMKDLLEYGRPPNRQLQPGSIGAVITQAVNACTLLAKRSEVRVVMQVDADLPAVGMDAKRLLQVFLNLFENAIQHLAPGGVVTMEAKAFFTATQQWIICEVKDTGQGFQENDLPWLFEPFFTRRRGGTGLGLSIVQKIVEEHGGKISAGNLPQGGAVMSLKFPVIATD